MIPSESKVNFDEMPIPQKIFFIAMGPIPEKFLINMTEIALEAREKGFEVEILVDDERYLENARLRNSKAEFREDLFKVIKIDDVLEASKRDPFWQKDGGHALSKLIRFINEEMIGLKNLALVSDILRYEYLRQQGGYFLDWGTRLVKKSTSAVEIDDASLVDRGFKSAGYFGDSERLTIPKLRGNDMIGSVANHPILNHSLEQIVKNIGPKVGTDYSEEEIKKTIKLQDKEFNKTNKDLRRSFEDEILRRDMVVGFYGPSLLWKNIYEYVEEKIKGPRVHDYDRQYITRMNNLMFQCDKRYLLDRDTRTQYETHSATISGMTLLSDGGPGLWAKKPKDRIPSFDDSTIRKKFSNLLNDEARIDLSSGAAAGAGSGPTTTAREVVLPTSVTTKELPQINILSIDDSKIISTKYHELGDRDFCGDTRTVLAVKDRAGNFDMSSALSVKKSEENISDSVNRMIFTSLTVAQDNARTKFGVDFSNREIAAIIIIAREFGGISTIGGDLERAITKVYNNSGILELTQKSINPLYLQAVRQFSVDFQLYNKETNHILTGNLAATNPNVGMRLKRVSEAQADIILGPEHDIGNIIEATKAAKKSSELPPHVEIRNPSLSDTNYQSSYVEIHRSFPTSPL